MKNSLKHYGYYDVLTVGEMDLYIMNEKFYTKDEFMKKMFGEEFMSSENKGEKVQYENLEV